MKKYAFAGAVFLMAGLMFYFNRAGGFSSPQQLTMTAGSTSAVGGRKASMWFAQPTEIYANNRIENAAMITLTCDGKENSLTLLKGEPSPVTCGLRVELLGIREPDKSARLFRGTFRITW